MRTFRRVLLDQALFRSITLIKGRVIDVGGKKFGRRGTFQPPLDSVKTWHYLNTDMATGPDCCGSAECLPFKDGSIDTLIMTEVLEYLSSPPEALKELYRILAPQGLGLISIPFLVPVHGDHWADRARFTPVKLRELFSAAGFQDPDIEPVGSLGAVIHDILYVACGYAMVSKNAGLSRILRIWLTIFRPVFSGLDSITRGHKNHITTGYFIIARKQPRNPSS